VTSTWTEADFDSLGWHDVHVHGFRVLDGEHGAGELWLDIDYILDWVCPSDLGPKQAKAEGIRGDYFTAKPGGSPSGRRR
jgi:hypothetical protein